jgi:hypothetical protein
MISSTFENVCLGRAERVLHIHDGAARQPQQVDRTLRNTRFISVRVRHDDILVFDDALGDGNLDLALPALPLLASELRGCPTSVRQLALTRMFSFTRMCSDCMQPGITHQSPRGRMHLSFVRGRSVAMDRCRGPGANGGAHSSHTVCTDGVQGEVCGAAGAVHGSDRA